ncbi:putative metallophosphoesterase At3g03305 isoform X1 [Amborella trichopoda]|uniref:Uncharacterized protein n=1 Tax=Amborella trichopoda TaxID=13333 RepID=W1NF52_AMBTC|nr:putative metallophosphoesterase At3g03305 isoform X1 [Amborella trichopoda]ERM94106.1 hypothetical protein AMTR_s00010p00125180 [Amborella trichopoda]|eukprot:XP_006826869.1 putative metallophosphoesterase At3g03305 isoform X1 [Amborella trichopoda]
MAHSCLVGVSLFVVGFFWFVESCAVSRERIGVEGEVVWVVQVSDLHVSSYHGERAEDLKRLLAPALKIIRPSLVLITGDLTDAKNMERTSTRQDESEWIQYKRAMDAVVKESGIHREAFLDIRGNHDKYGVPYVGGHLDFFSRYSLSSQSNRLNTIQSMALVAKDRKYVFLGIDDSMNIGIRGPSNLFGHPSDLAIKCVESELEYWDSHSDTPVTKITFGHFPMSFIASSESGRRYESIFSRHSVSAYLCGHLHAKFSRRLFRHHSFNSASDTKHGKSGQFWEWELGDWKESKLIRILAIDGGKVSFSDIDLLTKTGPSDGFLTTIHVNYPLDSRSMNGVSLGHDLPRDDVGALVFSQNLILNVTAKIFDSSRAFRLVEEVPLQITGSAIPPALYRAKLNVGRYTGAPATRFWLQVFAIDNLNREASSTLIPFSVDGKLGHLHKTWLECLIFHTSWEDLYLILLWSNIGFLFLLLFLPKLLNYFMQKSSSYQKWAMSVSVSSPLGQRGKYFLPLWFLIEGSRDVKIWCVMAVYLLYLLTFPWFWGHGTAVDSPIASMSIHGWRVTIPGIHIGEDGLGSPDVMVIILPFMYLIVGPLFILIYGLYTERALFYIHCGDKLRSSQGSSKSPKPNGDSRQCRSIMASNTSCKVCQGWMRTALVLVAFCIFSCISGNAPFLQQLMAWKLLFFRQASYGRHYYY